MTDSPIVLGGLQAFSSLANPVNTAALLATGRVNFYAHVHALGAPYSAGGDTLPAIGSAFSQAGSYAAEIDYNDDTAQQKNYLGYTFVQSFNQFGSLPDEVLVNGFWTNDPAGLGLANWKPFIAGVQGIGIGRVEPIFSPNTDLTSTFRYDLTSFLNPVYDNVRAAALAGGGLALDTPPSYVASLVTNDPIVGGQYVSFIEQEIKWANSVGIRSTVIISPYQSGVGFLAATQEFVQKLGADGALPQQYVVEDYGIEAGSATDKLTTLGSASSTNTLNGVALWLARNAPTTPFADLATPNASAAPVGGSPPPPATTAPNEPAGTAVTSGGAVGAGMDALVVDLSDNVSGGLTNATVSIDGMQLGGQVAVAAAAAKGAAERFTFFGDFGAGPHTVSFAGPGLVVNGLSYDGAAYAGLANANPGSVTVGRRDAAAAVAGPPAGGLVYSQAGGWITPSMGPVIGTGPDTVVLDMAEDSYQGDAQFSVSIDGRQFGGVQTATAANVSGQYQVFTLHPTLVAGQHTITVTLLNPTQPGGFINARNVYVQGLTVDGVDTGNTAAILSEQPASFVVGTALAAGAATTLQDGQSITTTAGTGSRVSFTNGTESVVAHGADTLTGAGGDEIIQIDGAATFTAGSGAATVTLNGPGATVTGGSGTLSIVAPSGANVITTQAGTANKIVLGGGANVVHSAGSDTINGTLGNQSVTMTGVTGTVATGFGSDVVTLGSGSYVVSSFGNDTVNAGSGAVTVLGGGSPNDPTQLVNAGSGNLLFSAGSGAATVQGGTGTDLLYAGSAGGTFVGGGGGHNTIVGGSGDVTISGGGVGALFGASTVPGARGGHDLLEAGSGTNVIYASAEDSVFGGPGMDTIWASQVGGTTVAGGTGHAVLYGQNDGDVLFAGGALGQTVVGGSGNESLSGGQSTGNNLILAGSGSEVIVAGLGNDSIVAGSGHDSIFTGPGHDVIQGGSGLATVAAGSGPATIWGGTGSQTIFGGSGGGLFLGGSGGKNAIVAGSGNVTLAGSGFNQQFGGTAPAGPTLGNDTLAGGTGPDVMYAGSGDYVFGGSGSDTIYGAASGGSSVAGGAGSTIMYGQGDGNVFFAAGAQSQTIIGGAGRESLSGGASTGAVSIVAGSGDQVLVAGFGDDILIAGSGNDSLFGGVGHDTMMGGSGNATVSIGAAASVVGGVGAMTVFGGTGNDTLAGGAGLLTAALGNGSDSIVFGTGSAVIYEGSGPVAYSMSAVANTARQETIFGFKPGHDTFNVSGGLGVTSDIVRGGSTFIGLSDGTQLTFLGLTAPAHS